MGNNDGDDNGLERGEGPARPLLLHHSSSSSTHQEINSSSQHEEDKLVGMYQGHRSQQKPGNPKAPAIILGFTFLEGIAFNGVGINLVLYLGNVLHRSNSSSAANVALWGGTSYFTPLLAGFLADTYWGYYRTIVISIILYLLGMVVIIFSALDSWLRPAPCHGSSCEPANVVQQITFFSGLYLITFGTGGIRSALLPLGADQFDDDNPVEIQKKWSFFSWFYLCSMVGVMIAGTLIVWIQSDINWPLGFGISAFCIALGSVGFLSGTPTYFMKMPSRSPLKSVLQVIVASLRKTQLKYVAGESILYECEKDSCSSQQQLAHTDEFRFLDKAAIISDSDVKSDNNYDSWRLCTITQVEELKILLRFLPIWATSIVYSAACTQMNSTFIQQGNAMNTKIGPFSVPPASLSSFGVISVVIWVLLYNYIISPVCRNCTNGSGLSQLQRMGIGRFTMIISMLTAGFVETVRLKSIESGKTISIAWQLPQYFIISGSEVFSYITQLEFFYAQAPESMRSICTAFALLSTALGNYLSSFIITLVAFLTSRDGALGWIPDDLNKGHLDYYFYVLAGMCVLNFAVYLVFAIRYTLKKVV